MTLIRPQTYESFLNLTNGSGYSQLYQLSPLDMIQSFSSTMEIQYNIQCRVYDTFLDACIAICDDVYHMMKHKDFYLYTLKHQLDENSNADTTHLRFHTKASENRASDEHQLSMWLKLMCSHLPSGSLKYFFARFGNRIRMELELRAMIDDKQRMKCLMCIPGIGKTIAETLIRQICPTSDMVWNSESDAQKALRRNLMMEMQEIGKKNITTKALFPVGEEWTPRITELKVQEHNVEGEKEYIPKQTKSKKTKISTSTLNKKTSKRNNNEMENEEEEENEENEYTKSTPQSFNLPIIQTMQQLSQYNSNSSSSSSSSSSSISYLEFSDDEI